MLLSGYFIFIYIVLCSMKINKRVKTYVMKRVKNSSGVMLLIFIYFQPILYGKYILLALGNILIIDIILSIYGSCLPDMEESDAWK